MLGCRQRQGPNRVSIQSAASKTYGGLWAHVDRGAFLKLALQGLGYSVVVNLAALVSPVFFIQVYDRVLTTGNLATLGALTLIALLAIALGAAFEQIRTAAFARTSAGVYVDLEPHVYRVSHASSLAGNQGRRGAAFDDLETVRGVLASPLPAALIDMAFAPLFLAVLFLLHFWIGVFAVFALLLLSAVTALTQWAIGDAMRKSAEAHARAVSIAESQLRGAEAASAMGFLQRALDRWAETSRAAILEQAHAAARAGGLNALARGLRLGAQILIIALAAAMAVGGAVSAGAIIASSILLARLLAPVDQLLGGWRQIAQARLAAQRLSRLLERAPAAASADRPRPSGKLVVEGLQARTPEGRPILRGVSFQVEPGEIVAIVGPTGAGKSTLLRCVLGVWPNAAGSVRLDGLALSDAARDAVGQHLGFLPQNADLWPGTIEENITRFAPADPAKLSAAIAAAGVEALVHGLPNGLVTEVGESGALLSAGQRRRIALARALYGDPTLVCLDEPEAHLDREGEQALQNALTQMKARGASVLFVAHQRASIAQADKILALADGAIVRFGAPHDVLPRQVSP